MSLDEWCTLFWLTFGPNALYGPSGKYLPGEIEFLDAMEADTGCRFSYRILKRWQRGEPLEEA